MKQVGTLRFVAWHDGNGPHYEELKIYGYREIFLEMLQRTIKQALIVHIGCDYIWINVDPLDVTLFEMGSIS